MARRRGGRFGRIRRRRGQARGVSHRPRNIPLLPVIGAGVAISEPILYGLSTGGSAMDKAKQTARGFSVNFLGYDNQTHSFTSAGLISGYAPPIVGSVGHMIMNKVGVNRILARHKLGFVF